MEDCNTLSLRQRRRRRRAGTQLLRRVVRFVSTFAPVVFVVMTIAATTTTEASSSSNTVGRIPPPPPPPPVVSVLQLDNSNSRQLPPPPPPPPINVIDDKSDDDETKHENGPEKIHVSIETPKTDGVEDHDLASEPILATATVTTTTTETPVDPILERFQRIVGNKHVHEKQKEPAPDQPPFFKQGAASAEAAGPEAEDATKDELLLLQPQRPCDTNAPVLHHSVSSREESDSRRNDEEHVHVDNKHAEEEDDKLTLSEDTGILTTTGEVPPVVPPPPPALPEQQQQRQAQLQHPLNELREPPQFVQIPPSQQHSVVPQQRQQYSQSRGYQQSQQPPLQLHGRHHLQPQIPLRTQQVPPPQYRQHPRPRQQVRTHSTTAAPIWKSLWNRVEQGLDSLAFVEEKVAERTHQWTNQVTHKAREILPTSLLSPSVKASNGIPNSAIGSANSPKTDSPQRRPESPQRRPESPDPHLAGILGGRKFAVLAGQKSSTTTQSTSQQVAASLASMYAMPEAEGNADDSDNDDEEHDMPIRTNNSWEPRPILRAGASEANPAASLLTGSRTSIPPFAPPTMDQTHRVLGEETRKRPFAVQTEQLQQMSRPSQPVRPQTYDRIEESTSFWSRIPMPSLPRLPSAVSKLLGRGSGSYRAMAAATMDVWKDEEQTSKRWSAAKRQREAKSALPKGVEHAVASSSSSPMPPLADLLVRCHNGQSTALLSQEELRKSRAIGRNKAVLDLLCLGSVVHGVRELVSVSSRVGLQDSGNDIVATMANIFVEASRGWTLYMLSVAILTAATNHVVFDNQIRGLTNAVGATVRGASRYSQLYMRLIAGQPVEKQVPNRMQQAAEAQVLELIQTGRLQSFVSLVLATMVIMTVSVIQPIVFAILGSFIQFVTLPELRSWPVPWAQVVSYLRDILVALSANINESLAVQFSTFKDSPIRFAFQIAFFGSLAAVAVLPSLAGHRKVRSLDDDEKEDEDVSASAFGTVTTLSNLGVSSASRLGLLSKSGALEGTLERWRATLPPPSTLRSVHSLRSWLRQVGYTVLSSVLLMAPIFMYVSCFAGGRQATSASIKSIGFNSIWDVSIMLLFAFRLSLKAIARSIESSNLRPYVQNFVTVLSEVVEEVAGSQKRTEPLLGTSISPTVGLSVRDLWAAHTSKRAWAVRGASFDCHNCEVMAILGDDGEGKSRLLTAIAEALVNPAKRSLTTTKVRGAVSIGGLDSMKWDRDQLKKRLGLFLNDVRTIADNAEFMSGFTLEEILEPMDGLSNQNPTAGARAASQALQITGLASSLIAQLPGKLSTVVTANENDLMPSALRPRCHALSPSEWSKLLLARVLAQTIFDNENVSSAPLVGSLLLLDDLMTYLSEVDELKLLAALRRTGAATVFTSHKWASGRLADRIVVVKEGAVVESGTHNELLARGPQQSMYAAKWHAMTTGT